MASGTKHLSVSMCCVDVPGQMHGCAWEFTRGLTCTHPWELGRQDLGERGKSVLKGQLFSLSPAAEMSSGLEWGRLNPVPALPRCCCGSSGKSIHLSELHLQNGHRDLSVQFSGSVVSDSLQPHGLHAAHQMSLSFTNV